MYIITNTNDESGSIMHSDRYLGADYTCGLQHWKYLKKEKINGKWRYYYDLDQLKDDIGVDERKAYIKDRDRYEMLDKEYNAAVEREKVPGRIVNYSDSLQKILTKHTSVTALAGAKAVQGAKLNYTRNRYKNTILGKTLGAEEAIHKGRKMLREYLNSVFVKR